MTAAATCLNLRYVEIGLIYLVRLIILLLPFGRLLSFEMTGEKFENASEITNILLRWNIK